MKFKEKLLILILNTSFCIAAATFVATMMKGWSVFVLVISYAVPIACLIASVVAFILKKDVIFKSSFVLSIVALIIIVAIASITKAAGLANFRTDGEKIARLEEIIRNTGKWGKAVYVLVQILQVIILPLPALVCYVPGSNIWGAGIATLLASTGVVIGSVIAYCIGRFFGKKAVIWIAGREATEKYVSYLGNKGKTVFVLMQILPFFPDDILCMIAGLTSMSFPFFLAVMVLVRPLIIAIYCYLGNGSIIPFSGWGIPVWIAIIAVCVVLAVLSFKYQDRVEKWIVAKFKRGKKSKTSEISAENNREEKGEREENGDLEEEIKEEQNKKEEKKE